MVRGDLPRTELVLRGFRVRLEPRGVDVAIVRLSSPEELDAIPQVSPGVPIVVVADSHCAQDHAEFVLRGAYAVLPEGVPLTSILSAIHQAFAWQQRPLRDPARFEERVRELAGEALRLTRDMYRAQEGVDVCIRYSTSNPG